MSSPTERFIEEAKQLSLDDLKAVSEQLLEEIEDREWDRVLTSQAGEADNKREYQKTLDAKKAGKFTEYVSGKTFEEFMQFAHSRGQE